MIRVKINAINCVNNLIRNGAEIIELELIKITRENIGNLEIYIPQIYKPKEKKLIKIGNILKVSPESDKTDTIWLDKNGKLDFLYTFTNIFKEDLDGLRNLAQGRDILIKNEEIYEYEDGFYILSIDDMLFFYFKLKTELPYLQSSQHLRNIQKKG